MHGRTTKCHLSFRQTVEVDVFVDAVTSVDDDVTLLVREARQAGRRVTSELLCGREKMIKMQFNVQVKYMYMYEYVLPTPFEMASPSGVKVGAGNVSQSTSSQKSFDQSDDHTLTRLSALAASHNCGVETCRSRSLLK